MLEIRNRKTLQSKIKVCKVTSKSGTAPAAYHDQFNFTPNYFRLNSLSDNITFVYVNCVFVVGPEHPTITRRTCAITIFRSIIRLTVHI